MGIMNRSEISYVSPLSVIMISSIGLVILQLLSLVAELAFNKSPLYLGPFFLAVLVAGAVYTAMGIIQKITSGEVPTERVKYLMTLLVAMILVVAAYVIIPQLVPEIFMPAVSQARAALGIRLG